MALDQVYYLAGGIGVVGALITLLLSAAPLWPEGLRDRTHRLGVSVAAVTFIAAALTFLSAVVTVWLGHVRDQKLELTLSHDKLQIVQLQHKNLKLSAYLAPRTFSEEQYNALQGLMGKVTAINVCSDTGWESEWYASQLAIALGNAGIIVHGYTRAPGVHSNANILFDQHAFSNPHGAATRGNPILSVLKKAGIPITSVLAVMPMDIKAPPNIPMIIIGDKPAFGSTATYMGKPSGK